MKQELNYHHDPTDKKIVKKINYNNQDYGTDGKHLYIGLFRIYNVDDEEIISKCWIRADSGHGYKFVKKKDRDKALKKLDLSQYRTNEEMNMNYKEKLKRLKERQLTDDELQSWKDTLFKELKRFASNVNNIKDTGDFLRLTYNVQSKLEKYREEIKSTQRESMTEINSDVEQELDKIAIDKYGRKYKDLNDKQQGMVRHYYNEWNDPLDDYGMYESVSHQKGDKVKIPDYLQHDKNKKQGYIGTIVDITPEEYYKIKFDDGTIGLYDSHIWN